MNTLYNLGQHLTLIGFALHNDQFDHHINVTLESRKYPKLFLSLRKDYQEYRIEPIVAIMEVIEISSDSLGKAMYHGRIIRHSINHIELPPGTLCKSGTFATLGVEQRNSVWAASAKINELMEINYAKKLAQEVQRHRNDDISILLKHIEKIENKLKLR